MEVGSVWSPTTDMADDRDEGRQVTDTVLDRFALTGGRAVVTGAGRGIGEGIAIAIAGDITDGAFVEELADRATAELGGLTLWVSNAGGGSR